jgi:N-carbamoylputrescine amidase
MRVTVCELNDNPDMFARDWARLANHLGNERSDLLLLPEMPFGRWFAVSPAFDANVWARAVETHEEWIARLPELGVDTVLGTRPVDHGDRRHNEAFAWTSRNGYHGVRTKALLPHEEGFWESHWYHAGDPIFEPVDAGAARIGFQICTEMWSMGHAQRYGKRGTNIVAIPRATSKNSVDKWIAGGRVAAIVSGSYSLSSNRSAPHEDLDYGGGGWIITPDGEVLAVTTNTDPFHTVEIDLAAADRAKETYPRYALEK